jgi:hypothetical protein
MNNSNIKNILQHNICKIYFISGGSMVFCFFSQYQWYVYPLKKKVMKKQKEEEMQTKINK